ncbi:Uncharacterised protein [Porphyromonas cangingivalis]|uniref:DUF5020 domain-containing protein n=1 Tax=Porphyromonas cangingivalis TaxID=36874 RepID=A0A099WV28_PORCN|nr:DUF5020 family protein [Porphyromonas cangingivalis]KGL49709.1 hypothetical protein HQ34_02480 [Porphyromonas cangingivalis]KGN79442.1 hypothetical protein HQ35_07745 [Porphyromonas cangingivalis]SPY35013.1 Uncharacterised protein [Porphyromonas cangingivalis]
MKKLFAIVALLVASIGVANAQNVQAHYNVGKRIDKTNQETHSPMILTIENLSFDKWGQTFYFVDLELGEKIMDCAYLEIARELKFWKAPIALHVEYNGGISKYAPMNHTYLGGVSYLWAKNGNAFNLSMMYRHDQGFNKPHNMQLTGVWSWTSWNRVFTLNGFADLWTTDLGDKGNVTFLAEPQAWINLNQFVGVSDDFNLSIGTEVRLAYNFINKDKFWVRPSLALKWTFK